MSKKRLFFALIAAALLIIFLSILYKRQPSNQNVLHGSPTPSSAATDEPIGPYFTAMPTAAEQFCERPYPDSSIWNVPIDWSVAGIHPMSDFMIAAFFESHQWIGSDTSQYTANIYFVSSQTPLVPVQLIDNRFRDAINDRQIQFGAPAQSVWVPLPAHALPAAGTDGQLVVVNMDTGEEWGLIRGMINRDGNWLAGGIYRYSIENSGIPPEGFGQRGAGIGQLAGIVRPCEVARGRIDHAVTIAYDYPCAAEICQLNGWPAVIPPFRKTDGRGQSRYDIPEGARLAIRPEVSEDEIVQACDGIKGCVVWLLNMQEYGGFLVDNSDHPKTYAEGDSTANWDPSVWTKDMLRNIPMDWYVVIDWDHPAAELP